MTFLGVQLSILNVFALYKRTLWSRFQKYLTKALLMIEVGLKYTGFTLCRLNITLNVHCIWEKDIFFKIRFLLITKGWKQVSQLSLYNRRRKNTNKNNNISKSLNLSLCQKIFLGISHYFLLFRHEVSQENLVQWKLFKFETFCRPYWEA